MQMSSCKHGRNGYLLLHVDHCTLVNYSPPVSIDSELKLAMCAWTWLKQINPLLLSRPLGHSLPLHPSYGRIALMSRNSCVLHVAVLVTGLSGCWATLIFHHLTFAWTIGLFFAIWCNGSRNQLEACLFFFFPTFTMFCTASYWI